MRELVARLNAAAEHYRERMPKLAGLLDEAIQAIEQRPLVEILRAERDLLRRQKPMFQHFLDSTSDELEEIESLIAELENANTNDGTRDA
jgi:hypothetical protein